MTVAELSSRLSYAELLDWQTYADEMGPLNATTRVERAIARAVSGLKASEIAPWPKASEEPATVQEVASFLTALVAPKKKE